MSEQPSAEVSPPRRWRRILLRLFVAVLLLAMAACAAIAYGVQWVEREAQRLPIRKKETVLLTIPEGSSLKFIAQILEDNGLIRSRHAFLFYVWRHKMARSLQAGAYRFHTQLTMNELAKALQFGYFERKATFPEGLTLEQIAKRLVKGEFIADPQEFLALKSDPELVELTRAQAPTIEGFLFPDTYFFEPGMSVRDITKRMMHAFNAQVDDAISSPSLTLGKPLTRLELVTLASMIEREARSTEEMPLMASVYYNRLKKKMKMECDATVRYAMNMWDRPVTYKDLAFDSPYNTYRYKGLPPGPICNPSIEALRAAAHPDKSEYLFYVYRGDGTHEYTKTYKEHLAAVKKYSKKNK